VKGLALFWPFLIVFGFFQLFCLPFLAFLKKINLATLGTPQHHGFSLLISVECACVDHYP